MSEQQPDKPQPTPAGVTDWRGVPIVEGSLVIWASQSQPVTVYEGRVTSTTPDERGHIRIRAIRRSNANASYTAVRKILRAMPEHLTVVAHLPPSDLPSDDALGTAGIHIERRRAIHQRHNKQQHR